MMNAAKLDGQARLPQLARPPATPTRFDSAMPTLKKRSRELLGEEVGARRVVHVAVHDDDVGMTLAELGQRQAERLAGRICRVSW